MTFGSTDADVKTTSAAMFAIPVHYTWYKWDEEDLSESDVDGAVPEVEMTVAATSTPASAEKERLLSPFSVVSSVTGILSSAGSYLSYTRRWYTSLSCVGAAM